MSEPTCTCGHEIRWHGDLGCGYLGWHYGKPKCGCRLTDGDVVRHIVAEARAAALNEALAAVMSLPHEPERADEPGNWKRGERHGRVRAAEAVADLAQPPP